MIKANLAGLGKRLCQEGFAYARELGCDHVISTCHSDGTEQFDRAIGMELCGRIPNGYREPWGDRTEYDELIFYKKI